MKKSLSIIIIAFINISLFATIQNKTLTFLLDLTAVPDAGGIFVTDKNPLSSDFTEPETNVTEGKLLENEDGSSSYTAWVWWDLIRTKTDTISVSITPSNFEATYDFSTEIIPASFHLGKEFSGLGNEVTMFHEGYSFDITPYYIGFSGYVPFTISIAENDIWNAKPKTTYISNIKITIEEK